MYGNLFSARMVLFALCVLLMDVCRLRMAPSWVANGLVASQYGVVRTMHIIGVGISLSFLGDMYC